MRSIVLASLLVLSGPALAEEVPDQVIRVSGEDQEMNEAIAKARDTLDDFLALAAHPPRGAHDFKLKVKFEDAHGVEHMWVTPFEVEGERFSGTLADDPETIRSVRAWQTVTFSRADITDWGYESGGKQVGSFTVCVLLKHMPAAQAEQYRSFGFSCGT